MPLLYGGMMQMKKAENYAEMIRVFTPFPLDGENYNEFYVNTSEERSAKNASKTIVNCFRININPYMKLLFMGHKGCGKSTEIRNISEHLKDKYCIVSFSIANEIELQGINYIDVIFLIMEQLLGYIDDHSELKINEGLLEQMYDYWNQEKFTENVKVEAMETNVDAQAKLSFLKAISLSCKGILKAGSESKVTIRKEIEPKLNILLGMMNDMVSDINRQLQEKYQKELLIVIEDMDKLDLEEARHIFVLHRRPLVTLKVKMLISFPIYMVYTPDFSMIRDNFDKCILYSMIKVNNSDYSRYEPGIKVMKAIVEKRMSLNLIEPDALDYMVLKSGGAIRDLFYMLSEAALYELDAEMPAQTITLDVARVVVTMLKSEYERNITSEEQYNMLIRVYKDPQPTNTNEDLSKLLQTLSVIEYNGERWCGVHPVLIDFLKEKGEI